VASRSSASAGGQWSSARWTAAAGAAAALLTVAAYLPSFTGGFYLDDLPNIIEADALHWNQVGWAEIVAVVQDAFLVSRPVANLSFALNHRVHGLEPFGFHLVNLLIHLCVAASLGWAAFLIAAHGRPAAEYARGRLAGLLVATLFALHPVNVQTVTYIVQRMTSLATLFSLLAFACYLTARRAAGPGEQSRRWMFVPAAMAAALACGSKEIALMLPAVVVAYELCFHRESWLARFAALRGAGIRSRIGFAAGVAGALALAWWIQDAVGLAERIRWDETLIGRDFSGRVRALTEARVGFFYLSLAIWPSAARLALEHQFALSSGWLAPWTTAASAVGWGIIAAGALQVARRWPRFGFPILAFLLLNVIESFPISLEIVFEHRMYLPMAFLLLGLAALLHDLPRSGRHIAAPLVVVLVFGMAHATYSRNLIWSERLTLLRDNAAKAPGKYRALYNYGAELIAEREFREAIDVLERALAANPASFRVRTHLGTANVALGRRDAAITHYMHALRDPSPRPYAAYNLGTLLDQEGRYDDAEVVFRHYLSIAPAELAEATAQVRRRLRHGAASAGPK